MKKNNFLIKFDKKSSDISNIKLDFYKKNKILLNDNSRLIKFLKKQPLRKNCKNCNLRIINKIDFISHGMGYTICKRCSHLNSRNDDNENFHSIYNNSNNFSYGKNYLKNFNLRVNNIYLPKVDYLREFLKIKKINKIEILDFGAGCGHFLKACHKRKILAKGLESNLKMINMGKKFILKNSLIHSNSFNESIEFIKNGQYTVICLISVIEHLKAPNKIFEAFQKSKNKYLFMSIPLFSLSTFIENVFQNIFPRHTAATHPHLYTYKSIKYILKKYKLEICSEWWFGSEMMDLNRSFICSFNKKNSKVFFKKFKENFSNEIDNLQSVLNKRKLSSEVHIIIQKSFTD
jgi:hypothetical protein